MRITGWSSSISTSIYSYFWEALLLIFRKPGAWFPLPGGLPWALHLQVSTCQATRVRTLWVPGGQARGDGDLHARYMSLEARHCCGLGPAEWTSDSRPRSSFLCFQIHLLLTSLSSSNHSLCFYGDFSSPLVHCRTKFRFSCMILVSKANVQFWNCWASETDKVKITKKKRRLKNNKSHKISEVFNTHKKSDSRCSLKYKLSPVLVFVYISDFFFSL